VTLVPSFSDATAQNQDTSWPATTRSGRLAGRATGARCGIPVVATEVVAVATVVPGAAGGLPTGEPPDEGAGAVVEVVEVVEVVLLDDVGGVEGSRAASRMSVSPALRVTVVAAPSLVASCQCCGTYALELFPRRSGRTGRCTRSTGRRPLKLPG